MGSIAAISVTTHKSLQNNTTIRNNILNKNDSVFFDRYRSLSSSQLLENLQNKLLTNKGLSTQELLGFQIMVHRVGLTIEVASKIADGISNSVRKLQNQS